MPPPGRPVPVAIPKPVPIPKAVAQPAFVPRPVVAKSGPPAQFGQSYDLGSGWTYQILSAKISYDAFDDASDLFPATGQKLLVLDVAIKNSLDQDQTFNYADHQFQVQDSKGRLYGGGNYRLASTNKWVFAPTCPPGQGAGQQPDDPLEVAIPIAEDAKVTNINLMQGRNGTAEEVLRFPVAGNPGGDARNQITPAKGEDPRTILKPGEFVPSGLFSLRVDWVQYTAGPFKGMAAPGKTRFAMVNLTVKNTTSKAVQSRELLEGAFDQVYFSDADGKKYPAAVDLGVMRADAVLPASDADFTPGEERPVRVICVVPRDEDMQTLTVGAKGGKRWMFDATGWD